MPEAGAYRSETAFTDSTCQRLLPALISAPDFGQLHKNDVAERILRVAGDADGRVVAIGFDPLMLFGVFAIGWIGHSGSPELRQLLSCNARYAFLRASYKTAWARLRSHTLPADFDFHRRAQLPNSGGT